MANICSSCGGVLGRDCFNPQECAEIGFMQDQQRQRESEMRQFQLEQRIAELEMRLEEQQPKETGKAIQT